MARHNVQQGLMPADGLQDDTASAVTALQPIIDPNHKPLGDKDLTEAGSNRASKTRS